MQPTMTAGPHVGPLGTASDLEPRGWLEQGATTVEYRELVEQLRTVDGWPMKLVTLQADGELRVGAVYSVPPWIGVIVIRDPRSVDEARALLTTARPNLRSDVPACVVDLWEPAS
jgi:hypothetical protein